MSAHLDLILGSLSKVKRAGKGYMACCPAHADRSPSLSIKEADNGKVLVHCFGGCKPKDIMAAIGLEMRDLFADNLSPEERLRYEREKLEERRQYLEILLSIAGNPEVDLSQDDLVTLYEAKQELDRITPKSIWLFEGGFADIPYTLPPPDYCGGWLRAGSYTIIYARAGIGKTAVCADLVKSLKAERFWMGMPCKDPGRIAWVNGDMPLWQVNERMAFLKGIDGVDLLHVDGINFMENQEELVNKLSNYSVAFLDNWAALFDLGDSNAAENWRAYNALIKRICATGCAVIVQTHEGKGEGTSSFGSSAQEWPAHTIIRLSRRELDEKEFNQCPGVQSSHARKAQWVKSRMGAQPEDVVFQLMADQMGYLTVDIEPFVDKFGESRLARKKPY